jgi:hypothetical protein
MISVRNDNDAVVRQVPRDLVQPGEHLMHVRVVTFFVDVTVHLDEAPDEAWTARWPVIPRNGDRGPDTVADLRWRLGLVPAVRAGVEAVA